MTEAGPADPVVTAVDDVDVDADDDLEPDLAPEPLQPSIAPGPRRLVVPEGEVIRRVDRFVADRTGLSRSYVQKLISEGRLVDDAGRQLRANSEVRGGGVTLEVPPPEVPYHLEPDPSIVLSVVYEDDDLLIVDKPAGLVVHPAPGHWQGTLVNALLARDDHYGGIAGVARPGIVHRLDRDTSGPDHGRAQRRRAGLAHGPAQGAPGAQDVPRARPGQRRRGRGTDRGADRARPQGPQADGRRQRRPPRRHRLPRPRAVRGLDAARARPRHRPHAPDPRPSRRARPSGGRRPGLRDRHVAPRPGRPRAPVPPRLAAGARVAVDRPARPRRGAAPRRRSRPCSTGLRAGEASAGRRPQGGAA